MSARVDFGTIKAMLEGLYRRTTAAMWAMLAPLALAAAACAGAADGEACLASKECDSGLCYANQCLDPGADDDNDGLTNAREHQLQSHPMRADTDGDGKSDGDEVGPDPSQPLDSDSDGRPDLVESQSADADLDCLPDEKDAHDAIVNSDVGVLKAIACSDRGVCAGQMALVTATCPVGTGGPATCLYDKVPGYAAIESCDGIDNDCDGLTDEDNSWHGVSIGQACQGEGGCGDAPGVVSCHNGKATCSTNPDGANPAVTPELCDGIDNNCDGATDEVFAIDGFPVGSPCKGKGECGVGTVICGPGGQAQCSTMPGGPDFAGGAESCNGKDDDCDGATDEALMLGALPLGADCDGVGACGPGTVVCGSQGVAVCSTEPGGPNSQAIPEACNSKDDNCNGKTDEGLAYEGQPLGTACWGLGECGKGVVVCSGDGKATCSTMPGAEAAGEPVPLEKCDGKDDDCDGQTDEGFLYQGAALGAGCDGIGACGVGVVECAKSGAVTCSSNPDGSAAQHVFEQCNNIDDNCDGVTDDSVPPTFGPKCPAKGVCVGSKGAPICAVGAWTCDFPGVKGFEGAAEFSCDGLDNDCDGKVDEKLPHQWAGQSAKLTDGSPAARRSAAFCSMADRGYLVGGRLADGQGVVGELWELTFATRAWSLVTTHPQLAREGAALVCVPGGTANAGLLWVIGGMGPASKPVAGAQVDLATGLVGSAPWSKEPAPRHNSVAVQHGEWVWIGNRGPDPAPAPLQRLGLKTFTWMAADDVPQPPFEGGAQDLCVSGKTLWALGAPSAKGRLLASLPQQGTKWKLHPPVKAQTGGTLTCGGDGVDLLSVKLPSGGRGSFRFSVATAKWKSIMRDLAVPETAIIALPAPKGAQLAIGATSWSVASTGLWTVADQPKSRSVAPAAVLGARWVVAAGAVYRVGGRHCPTGDKTCYETAPRGWRFAGETWEAVAAAAEVTISQRCDPLVVPDPDHARIFLWGSSCDADQPALLLDMLKNAVSALPLKHVQALPKLLSSAQRVATESTDQSWLVGDAPSGSRQVWRVELKQTPTKTLLWSHKSAGPKIDGRVALSHDAVLNRIVAFVPGPQLRVWALDLDKPVAWELVATESSLVGGSARLAGDALMANPLLIVAFDPGGPPPEARLVNFSAKVKLASTKLALGPLTTSFHLAWQRNLGRALLGLGRDASGTATGAIDSLLWTCK